MTANRTPPLKSPIFPHIRRRMRELDIKTDRAFAEQFGFSQPQLSRLLYGHIQKGVRKLYKPQIDQLPRIAEATDLSVHQVLDLYLGEYGGA